MRPIDAATAGPERESHAVGRVDLDVAGSKHVFCLRHRELLEQAARLVAHAVDVGDQDQLVGLQRGGDAAGSVFHRQVERFASRREAEWRRQYDRVASQRVLDCVGVDLAHDAGEHEIHAFEDADRTRGDEVAADHTDLGVAHRRVRQSLRERGLDVEPDFARRFLGAASASASVTRIPCAKRASRPFSAICACTCGREP